MRKRSTDILILAAAGICLALLQPTAGSVLCAVTSFVGIVLITFCTNRASGLKGWLTVGAVFAASMVLRFWGMTGYFYLDIPVLFIAGAVMYLVLVGYAKLAAGSSALAMTLLLPLLWMICYALFVLLNLPFFARLDYTLIAIGAINQCETLIGSIGLTFVFVWLAALTEYTLERRKAGGVILALLLAALMFVGGTMRLAHAKPAEGSIRAAYTTGPYVGDFMSYVSIDYETAENSAVRAAEEARRQDCGILIFNEETFELSRSDTEKLTQRICELAKENELHIVVGFDVFDEGGFHDNIIVWVDAQGEVRGTYRKTHLVPMVETGYEEGNGEILTLTTEIDGRSVKAAAVICYDSNFSGYLSRIDADTQLLILPSWDWKPISGFHADICSAVAVENGITVIKPTYDGVSVVIDPYGNIIHSTDTDTEGFEKLHVAELPIYDIVTPFGTAGSFIASMMQGAQKTDPENHTRSAMVYAVIATELMAAAMCLVLLYAGVLRTKSHNNRRKVFINLVIVNLAANLTDAISWMLDGRAEYTPAIYVTTVLSLLLSFWMYACFYQYVSVIVREKASISRRHMLSVKITVPAATVLTLIGCLNGSIFTIENGMYVGGEMYIGYLIINAATMTYIIIDAVYCLKYLSGSEFAALISYIFLPGCAMVMNFVLPEYSFVYPTMSVALLILFAILQANNEQQLISQTVEISRIAKQDALTGLQNRRAFNEMEAGLTGDSPVGIIFCDVNGLKYTNDNFGHEAGDRQLYEFALLLLSCCDKENIYRISGDEFAIVMRETGERDFRSCVSGLRSRIGETEKPAASVGTAYGRQDEFARLLKSAENEMYAEKQEYHRRYSEFIRAAKTETSIENRTE